MIIITTTIAGTIASNKRLSLSSTLVALAEGLRDIDVVTVSVGISEVEVSIGTSVVVTTLLVDGSREVVDTVLAVGILAVMGISDIRALVDATQRH